VGRYEIALGKKPVVEEEPPPKLWKHSVIVQIDQTFSGAAALITQKMWLLNREQVYLKMYRDFHINEHFYYTTDEHSEVKEFFVGDGWHGPHMALNTILFLPADYFRNLNAPKKCEAPFEKYDVWS
jgi:hypothetical protein